jgi:hypothetical protein
MFRLRCTAKLHGPVLKATGSAPARPAATTTKLGDWFLNRFNFGAQRYIICTSEQSRLTVLISARDLSGVRARLVAALDHVLTDLEVPAVARERELREMQEFSVDKTNNRSILGSMNDMAFLAEVHLAAEGALADLRTVNVRLAAVPCTPLRFEYPGDRAADLLEGWRG